MSNTATTTILSEQRSAYAEQGFLISRGLYSAEEISALASEAETLLGRNELIHESNLRCRWQTDQTTGECHFDCFDPVTDIGPVSKYFALHPSLLTLLREIYEGEPKLLKDKLIFKRPGAGGYGLHQDYIGWESFPTSFLTVIVAIDPANEENGATEVFPGAHRRGYLSPCDGDYHELNIDRLENQQGILLDLAPGDVAIFGGYMPHRSAANSSDRWRRQLYLSYNDEREGGDRRTAHYREFQLWLEKKYAEYGKTGVYFQ